MDTCYIPNNPNFGPDLWRPPSPETSPLRALSISPKYGGNTLVPLTAVTPEEADLQEQHQSGRNTPQPGHEFSSRDIITNLTISTLDLEPLPGFFTFSPDQLNYRDTTGSYQPQVEVFAPSRPEKDQVTDVLASLKNIIHSGPMSPSCGSLSHYGAQNHGGFTYAIHPQAQYGQQHQYQPKLPQFLPQPSLCPSQYPDSGIGGPTFSSAPMHGSLPSIFPSMNVNVSMNMTMGVPPMGYGFESATIQPQVQWNTLPQTFGTQPSYNHPLLSPIQVTYNPYTSQATYNASSNYSFSSEFRATTEPSFEWKEQKPASATFKPIKICGSETRKCSRKSPDEEEEDLPGVDKPNLCRVCGKTYARPSTLKTHLRTHSGEKPYKCHDCNKSFSQAANLTAHVRTHSGEKPFKCGICERRFSQSSSVTTHMRTHSGDRPYRCRMCRKAFSDSSTLTKHMRIHSGEKPYQCKLCMLRFSQSGNLNRHMRVHSGTM